MSTFIIAIHVLVCIALILIVLLQTGKGADMGAVFGGGSSQTLFGSGGASTFLTKMTTGAAVVFMLTSLSLAYFSGQQSTSSIVPAATQAPATEKTQLPDAATQAPAQTKAEQAESAAEPSSGDVVTETTSEATTTGSSNAPAESAPASESSSAKPSPEPHKKG